MCSFPWNLLPRLVDEDYFKRKTSIRYNGTSCIDELNCQWNTLVPTAFIFKPFILPNDIPREPKLVITEKSTIKCLPGRIALKSTTWKNLHHWNAFRATWCHVKIGICHNSDTNPVDNFIYWGIREHDPYCRTSVWDNQRSVRIDDQLVRISKRRIGLIIENQWKAKWYIVADFMKN